MVLNISFRFLHSFRLARIFRASVRTALERLGGLHVFVACMMHWNVCTSPNDLHLPFHVKTHLTPVHDDCMIQQLLSLDTLANA